MCKYKNFAILGLGSWGFALGMLLDDNKCNVKIWEFNQKRLEKLLFYRHFDLLPDLEIPENIFLSNNLYEVIKDSEVIIFAIPSIFMREVSKKLKDIFVKKNINIDNKFFLNVAKGLEENTYIFMSEIIKNVLNTNNVFTLSGPTHAEEVSKKILTSVCIAGKNKEVLDNLQITFSNDYFRVYTTCDIKGVEIGGAIKNIIAIACGIIDGLKLGDNTKAALITRGLTEIIRVGKILGAEEKTFFGLSGVGDLIVTCISKHSRNRYFGEKLGKGIKTKDILNQMNMIAEGVYATKSFYNLIKKNKIDAPIISEIYSIIYEDKSPKDSIKNLMQRELKEEKIF